MPEVKRKPGRPSARQEPEPQEKSDMPPAPVSEPGIRTPTAREPWSVIPEPHAGPLCLRCQNPTEQNRSMFKALGLTAIRCMNCRHVAIEGDTLFFDLVSASTGQLLRRALVFFDSKHPTVPVPQVKGDKIAEVIESDINDPRWSEYA